ncbi:hypothetical protein EX30DRAFT_349304 [Ascodesmis nigricans]|uniref:Uncharacterized protein n=1 Tax=Ascodesmis nigricans TaxID=341454 RepID=A0A4S2MVB3_9PEZI|nr:hypothetical protein EX30DRAFT_349304 [Ascodesmis nigricans]
MHDRATNQNSRQRSQSATRIDRSRSTPPETSSTDIISSTSITTTASIECLSAFPSHRTPLNLASSDFSSFITPLHLTQQSQLPQVSSQGPHMPPSIRFPSPPFLLMPGFHPQYETSHTAGQPLRKTLNFPGIIRSKQYPIPSQRINPTPYLHQCPDPLRHRPFPRQIEYALPINLTRLISRHTSAWNNVQKLVTRIDHDGTPSIHWVTIAAARYLQYHHHFALCLDRKGDVWVRYTSSKTHFIPFGGRNLDLSGLRPPPTTAWLARIANLVITESNRNMKLTQHTEVIGVIAAYESITPGKVTYAMLPTNIIEAVAKPSEDPNGLRPVNGWMVFRSWFLSYTTNWDIPPLEITSLARHLYLNEHKNPLWSSIGRLWSFCLHLNLLHSSAESFRNFVRNEVEKQGIIYTPLDLLTGLSVDVPSLLKVVGGITNAKRKHEGDGFDTRYTDLPPQEAKKRRTHPLRTLDLRRKN